MSALAAFVKKEFLHIFRDKRTLLIIFCMPIALVMIFGVVISTEIYDAKIAIVNASSEIHSQKLIEKINSSNYFKTVSYLRSSLGLEEVFRAQNIKLAILIPQNFDKDFGNGPPPTLQLIADASDLNVATTLIGNASNIIQAFAQENAPPSGAVLPFQITTRMYYNPEQRDVFMFIPGILALVLMIVSAMMTSITLVREKEFGTWRVLSSTPLPSVIIIVGKLIPYFLLSSINACLILGLAVFVFGMPIHGNPVELFLVCLLFIFTSLSLGIFISSIANTQQAAILASMVGLFLPTTFLSGFIFPIENMPVWLQPVAQIVPAKWFIEAIKRIMLKGAGLGQVLTQIYVLAGMATVLLAISIRRSRKQAT
ncbi:MAG: ABC transporter permease [Cystobacterineae bacterium]|nr:ABC transporter permease [Cystobacterineae bacterium]